MKIGQLAKAAKVSVDTLRYYEKIGLIKPEKRSTSGYRLYGHDDIKQLKFIKNAQSSGFSLKQISHLLNFRQSPIAAKPEIRQMTKEKVMELSEHIDELINLRNELQALVGQCEQEDGDCPIIKKFNEKM